MIRILCISIFSLVLSLNAWAAKENKTKGPYPQVVFQTSLGKMTIELYPNEAPITVKNFLRYVDEGFYTGIIFHRVVPNFVVQAGGYDYNFSRKETHEPIKNEAKNRLYNLEATLSMARTSDPDSATSQFFINLKYNENLDYGYKASRTQKSDGYAVFGKVIEGFEVVKKIEREPRGLYRSRPEAPNYPVIIEKAYRIEDRKD
ncbi:peptidylprolyl isomerase [Agaribacterium sp. ZY112]|uniref:peptidylprolyl isomerase n=1 Tax=Agaribacterium sp. ZY112 TaxID=3233574 RepID=UPI003525C13A